MKTLVILLFYSLLSYTGLFIAQAQNTQNGLSPLELVNQQIEGWNTHNATLFAMPYSDTTQLFIFPQKSLKAFRSIKELQQYYADFFTKNPVVQCQIKGQIVLGNTVVLNEYITGRADGKILESIVTYKISNGKIVSVYFDRKEVR
ncbi:nuclear transport factor 2 family protein [Xanthocytophaga agilis]|uniref:Nuclear transport factor 2 family protein n=1 Tax=Xanthocytophaga agilis TaxID=3048010 RepID=A0AAE3RBE7_9BACT|nr:nuclear transport factor 2 family protein [Xanthocytophaga agilis]MDJ1505029.1 nuclear transport factor 2 family protein [Xanthocytophaga agilis]